MGDYHILMQLDIDTDRAKVHHALATQDGIRSWWSKRTDGPAAGQLHVHFPDRAQPFEFSVEPDSDERIEWVTGAFPQWWAGTAIRWDLSDNPERPGTRLLFSHRNFDPDNPVIPIVTPAWALIIQRLKAYAETGEAQPFFDF